MSAGRKSFSAPGCSSGSLHESRSAASAASRPRKGGEQQPRCETANEIATALKEEIQRLASGEPRQKDNVVYDRRMDNYRVIVYQYPSQDGNKFSLSPREREITQMIAQGYPNKTIAVILEISAWTVGTHLRRIFAKLQVASRAAMIAKLMEHGLCGRVDQTQFSSSVNSVSEKRTGQMQSSGLPPRTF